MKDGQILEKINQILEYSEVYEEAIGPFHKGNSIINFWKYSEEQKKHFSFYLDVKYSQLYQEVLESIYAKQKIKSNYHIKTVKSKFNDFLFSMKLKDDWKKKIESNYQKFIQKFINVQKNKMYFFHKVYGLDITVNEPIEIGCFTFYNYVLHKEQLLEKVNIKTEAALIQTYEKFSEHEIWVGIELEGIDIEKGKETANNRFEALQGIFQFILDIEGLNGHLVCIIEDINQSLNQCYYFCNGLYGESSEVNGYRGENIDIFNFLCDNNKLFISLVERIFVFDENEVNNRIINAFIIYSRIVYEHSNAQKFILYIMAIEALIGYDNESLSELLSGFLSALLSKNEETYNVVKANFKKVYTQRSDISHGSTVYILKDDVRDAEWYCINLIYSFIINEEITQIKKTKELKKYLENKVKSLEMKTDESI